MFKMIRQFTFHHPKQIIAPTLWLFLSQAFSILPAILAYMAIYLLGQAFYPPYTLDIALLIKSAVIGIAYVLLQYVVELISYYNTYGRAYHDTADKRITYIQKLRRQMVGGHKKVISYFLRNGVASVTPFPVSAVLPRG